MGSGEIPDLTSLPEIHDEPVFLWISQGGLPQWWESTRRFPKGNLLLVCPSLRGVANAPKNVMKNDDFTRTIILKK